MSVFDSIGRNIKNIFVGSHRGDDFKLEPLVKKSDEEWFQKPHPHDSMPIANGSNRYAPPEKLAELELEVKAMKEAERNPRPEEDAAEWFSEKVEEPVEGNEIEEEKSIHQEMYEIATAKYNPFAVGGSENIHDFDSLGGSENRL